MDKAADINDLMSAHDAKCLVSHKETDNVTACQRLLSRTGQMPSIVLPSQRAAVAVSGRRR